MGYKIIYGEIQREKGNFLRFQAITAAFFLLFVLCVKAECPDWTETVRNILVSEKLSSRALTVTTMIQEWEQDGAISDAVEAFCQEIFGGK